MIRPFESIRLPSGGIMISHLLYADDLSIFVNGGKAYFRKLMEVLHKYEHMFGQLVSPQKSSLFFSKHVSEDSKQVLKRLSGFEEGVWPCTYLGFLCMWGRMRVRMFDLLLEKIHEKLAGWNSKLLSFGGKFF